MCWRFFDERSADRDFVERLIAFRDSVRSRVGCERLVDSAQEADGQRHHRIVQRTVSGRVLERALVRIARGRALAILLFEQENGLKALDL